MSGDGVVDKRGMDIMSYSGVTHRVHCTPHAPSERHKPFPIAHDFPLFSPIVSYVGFYVRFPNEMMKKKKKKQRQRQQKKWMHMRSRNINYTLWMDFFLFQKEQRILIAVAVDSVLLLFFSTTIFTIYSVGRNRLICMCTILKPHVVEFWRDTELLTHTHTRATDRIMTWEHELNRTRSERGA